jgi:hypothetical protein
MTTRTTGYNTGFASGGLTCKLGALCFYSSLPAGRQVQCRLTVLCSETGPNAKPENVSQPIAGLSKKKRSQEVI